MQLFLKLRVLLFLGCLALPSTAFCQQKESPRQSYMEDDGWLLRFIHTVGDQPDKFEYFLKEIELSPEQRRIFLFEVKQYLKQLKEAHQNLRELNQKSLFDKSDALKKQLKQAESKPEKLYAGMIAKTKQVLLGHQVVRMKQAIIQRVHLQMVDVESFQLPIHLKGLKMTDQQKQKLKAVIDQQTQIFQSKKTALRQQTWKKILKDLPEEIREETIDLMNLEKEKK